jgi:hypothetical protein
MTSHDRDEVGCSLAGIPHLWTWVGIDWGAAGEIARRILQEDQKEKTQLSRDFTLVLDLG